MPIYEYRCKDKKCDHQFEALLKHSEREEPQPCSKCKGVTQRLVSRASFSLKGGGWASDGYSG